MKRSKQYWINRMEQFEVEIDTIENRLDTCTQYQVWKYRRQLRKAQKNYRKAVRKAIKAECK